MKRMVQAFELIFDFFNSFNREASRRLGKEVFNQGELEICGDEIVQPVSTSPYGVEALIRYNFAEKKVTFDIVSIPLNSSEGKAIKQTVDFFNRFEV